MLNRVASGEGVTRNTFEMNALRYPKKPGYIQTEDGGWVPPSYYQGKPANTNSMVIGQMNIQAPSPLESARMVASRLAILQTQLTRR
jgi:hypothetical protein